MRTFPPARPAPESLPEIRHGRRDVLRLLGAAAVGVAAHPFGAVAQQPATPQAIIQGALGEGQRFEPGAVIETARALSRRPYAAPASDLPSEFANLTAEQYAAIRALPPALIWGGENRGFVVEPLHRGFLFTDPVLLATVEDGQIRRIGYDRNRFEFGRTPAPASVGEIGFSGFRLHASFGNGQPTEFAVVQGATFFRAIARGQTFGVAARALTLAPAETRGEEFPTFRGFWIERPTPGMNALVVHGLIDSPSASGAVRMTFRPGDVTIVDMELTLFPRVALEHVGLGGMGSSYLFGPNDRRGVDDVRPAVFESKGLQMLNGQGEWLWRPLQNPETLQISAFVDTNPRGFGLMQRDRDFSAFQDDSHHFERCPSLWIEPIGEWGQGAVQLIEIPSDSELNDNILAYWRPRAPMAAGAEVAVSYRQFWSWAPPEGPPLALVTATSVGQGSAGQRRRFAVDFVGDGLAGAPPPELRPSLTTNTGTILGLRLWPYPDRKFLRVGFELDPGNENACEMRLVLEAGGKPLSETWLYRWTP